MGACGESGIRETHQTAMETGVLGNVNCAWVYIHMSIGYEPNVEPEREDRFTKEEETLLLVRPMKRIKKS